VRILAVSDLRVQDVNLVERVAERVSPDLILYAGDDVGRFSVGPNSWSPLAERTPLGLAGVVGNDCRPADARALAQPGCRDLHREPLLVDGLAILGLQGAPGDECEPIGSILYTKRQALSHIEQQIARAGSRSLLLVSHAPPRGALDMSIRFGPSSAGSSAVRAFADLPRARGIVCGHVHLQGGRTQQLGRCVVANVASHDHPGAPLRYMVLEWTRKRLTVVEIGTEKDRGGLDGLVGAGTRRAEKLARGGFRSIKDILDADDRALGQMFSRPEVARRVRARARAAHTRSPVILDPTFVVDRDAVIVDVETSFLQDDPWLVGYKSWGERRVHQLHELDPKHHRRHLLRVMEELARRAGGRFLQWGPFDRGAIDRAHSRLKVVAGPILHRNRWTNAGAWIERAVALPVADYKLKTVGHYFDYRFAHPDVDGRQLATWYQAHRDRGERFDLRRALAYNRDDVQVVEHIVVAVANLVIAEDAVVEPALIAPAKKRGRRARTPVEAREALARAVSKYSASLQSRVARGQMTPEGHAVAIANFRTAMQRRMGA
jgi:Icc-related predicted phosphoesterase